MLDWKKLRDIISPSKQSRYSANQFFRTKLLIETVTYTFDIPYADTFRLEGRWEVVPVTEKSCHLTVNIGVHFMKKTLFKGQKLLSKLSNIRQNRVFFTKRE